MRVVYDENNHPSHIEREIIVRFDPKVMRFDAIDEATVQSGRLNAFINDQALEQLSQVLGYNATQIETFKIFGAMTSADTLSIDRMGATIRLDDHWASLVLQLPLGAREQQTCDRLNTLFPLVRYAHLNWVAELDGTGQPTGKPNDPFYPQQANLHPTAQYPDGHINVQPAWIYQTGSNFVRVGVFDTGIDEAHPDLSSGSQFSSVVTMGRDYLANAPQFLIQDNVGHGTAVAGIIAAKRNNGSGVAGIAGGDYGANPARSGVQLADLKIAGAGGIPLSAAISAIVEGATFSSAASGYGFGLHVMNHSWGGPQGSEALKDAVRTAYRNKCVFVASRGNGPPQSPSVTSPNYPASYPDDWVLSVGASGRDGQHKTSANGNLAHPLFNDAFEGSYAGGVDLIAPGTAQLVYTTRSRTGSWGNGLYTDFNGSSAAAPHASGVAALVLSNQNSSTTPQHNLAPEDVEHLLERTASDRAIQPNGFFPGYDDYTGWGLLNAGQAVFHSRSNINKFAHAGFINPSNSASVDRANVAVILPNAYTNNPIGSAELAVTFYTYNSALDTRTGPVSPMRSSAGFPSSAYPNPTGGEIRLTYAPLMSEALTVEILSSTGVKVRQQRFP